ncbi:MAG: sugar phosphate nucleotidyltransferase [Patescibacteria group bacterium]
MKAVILAGGGGTRLWPLSTAERPKQFQKLVSNKTMLEETLGRLDHLSINDIYIAINERNLELLQKLCPQIPEENIIIEPALRDTASCIGYAAAIIENKFPGEVMAVIYADHLIKNKKEFQQKLKIAEELALKENTLNIIEVTATEPNTNYGYVKIGKKISDDVFALEAFIEKPNLATAKKFIQSGDYFWNTGIYVWKAATILQKYEALQPDTYKKFVQMMKTGSVSLYPTLEKISIDYAIMEKVDPKEVRIIKADLGWSDIGTWEAIWKELCPSSKGNLTRGETELIDCEGCLVYSDNKKKIAAIGLKNTVIVDTPDGLLITDKKDSKRVKEIQ